MYSTNYLNQQIHLAIICIGLDKFEIIKTLRSFDVINEILSDVYIVSPTNFDFSNEKVKFRIHLIYDSKYGIYEAMNLGLKSVQSQAFMIINAGDYLNIDKTINAFSKADFDAINLFVSDKNLFWRFFFKVKICKFMSKESFAKYLLRFGFMPCSHQNIIYSRHTKDHPFPVQYRISADYVHLHHVIFKLKRGLNVVSGSIGITSRGGVSDSSRVSVILQRLTYLNSNGFISVFRFPLYIYLFLITISNLFRN